MAKLLNVCRNRFKSYDVCMGFCEPARAEFLPVSLEDLDLEEAGQEQHAHRQGQDQDQGQGPHQEGMPKMPHRTDAEACKV